MSFVNYIKSKRYISKYAAQSIIVFSEGTIYYTTNKPIIDELIKEVDVLYITIEKNDSLLLFEHERFHAVYLDFDFWGQLLMATISGKLLITTTPSLEVLALKKSPSMKHYSYFMHAPGDIHYYQKYSFDYFDSIVCTGDYQIKSLEKLEKVRGSKIKEKVSLGLIYGDKYYQEMLSNKNNTDNMNNTILIASSWCNNNFLNKIDYDIFELVFKHGFNIIYRPHPMSFKYEKKYIDDVMMKYKDGYGNLNFTLDTNISSIESMQKSCALISGFSGMVSDYILFAQKPAIVYDMNKNNVTNIFEKDDLDTTPWNFQLFSDTSYTFSNISSLESALVNINNNKDNKDKIQKYIADIAYFGNATKQISQYYIEKFKSLT